MGATRRFACIMNDQTLSLWRQIERVRFSGKKRLWPVEAERPAKTAANDA
jgi:hypothetical protein